MTPDTVQVVIYDAPAGKACQLRLRLRRPWP